jgi:hypothetical protein
MHDHSARDTNKWLPDFCLDDGVHHNLRQGFFALGNPTIIVARL